MPRKNRLHYRFSFHHVMLRGNNRKNIFYKESDYHTFIEVLAEAADMYGFKVHLYCLMTNHIHLVIEVRDIPISRVMQGIAGRYAKIHNHLYKKTGHLFQGRFKSRLISSDEYLLELCYYIHMNPVKAKMCKVIDEYRWSSHGVYNGYTMLPWLSTDYITSIIKNRYGVDACYFDYIQRRECKSSEPLFCEFDESGNLIISNSIAQHTQYRPCLSIEGISLAMLTKIICDHMVVKTEAIASPSLARRVSLARSMVAYFAHYHAKYTFEDIACVMDRKSRSISKTLHLHLKLAKDDKQIRNLMDSLERKLAISVVDSLVF